MRRKWWLLLAVPVVVALVVAGVWVSRPDPPEPLEVACKGPGLGERRTRGPADDSPSLVPRAPEAVRKAPKLAGVRSGGPQWWSPELRSLDTPSTWYGIDPGLRKGPDVPSSVQAVDIRTGSVVWEASMGAQDLRVGMQRFPGNRDLLAVAGEYELDRGKSLDGYGRLLAVVAPGGEVLLRCTAPKRPRPPGTGPDSRGEDLVLSADGSVLFATNARKTEGGEYERWVGAYATDDGSLLWSKRADAAVASADFAYVAGDGRVARVDLRSGERDWVTEVDVPAQPEDGGTTDDREGWELTLAGGVLYAYSHAGPLVALDVEDGERNWHFLVGDSLGGLSIRPMAGDDVLLEFGYGVAFADEAKMDQVRRSSVQRPVWDVGRISGGSVLAAARLSEHELAVIHAGPEEDQVVLPLPDEATVALADTVAYVLDREGWTVTGYDLDDGGRLWRVPVKGGEPDQELFGIYAYDGGFAVGLPNRKLAHFS